MAAVVFISAFAQADTGTAVTDTQTPSPAIPARLDGVDPIHKIINSQLKAFRHSDPAGAYRYASDAARLKYGSAKQFFVMMRNACGALPSHVSFSFLERSEIGGKALQKIEFLNSDGSTSTGFYRLVKNADNSWAVDGCLMLESNAQPI